jgi:hypothetical protein
VNCFCRNIQAFERRKFPMGYGVQNRTKLFWPFILQACAKVIAIFYRMAMLFFLATVSGCSAAATPCRVTGAVVEVVPLIGGILGAAFRACGDTID